MMLFLPFLVFLLQGLLCLLLPTSMARAARGLAYIGTVTSLCIMILLGMDLWQQVGTSTNPSLSVSLSYVPSWHIDFSFALDNLSFWFVMLAHVLALLAINIVTPQQKLRSYYGALSWSLAGLVGLFLTANVFFFLIFWELALVPMYWIVIAQPSRLTMPSIVRFIVYTQASGMILLLSVTAVGIYHYAHTGIWTFDYAELMAKPLSINGQRLIFAGFLLAFLIKLPIVPFHSWVISLFTDAPASVVFLVVLVKTAAFGFLRFSWGFFPQAIEYFSTPMLALGAFTLIYSSLLAFSQIDPKKIIAYLTISHAGLLLMGVFCTDPRAFFGVVLLVIASAISTAAMLKIMSRLEDHTTIDLADIRGLWTNCPRLAVMFLIFILANLGFPIFGNFLGEWLVLWSAFMDFPLFGVIAALGMVFTAAYSLRFFHRLCFGEPQQAYAITDLRNAEVPYFIVLIALVLTLGLYPSVFVDHLHPPFISPNSSQVLLP